MRTLVFFGSSSSEDVVYFQNSRINNLKKFDDISSVQLNWIQLKYLYMLYKLKFVRLWKKNSARSVREIEKNIKFNYLPKDLVKSHWFNFYKVGCLID